MSETIVRDRTDIPALTGVRALAAAAVLLLHLDQQNGNEISRLFFFVDHGARGVDLFFVLSGYILAHVYGCRPLEGARSYGRFLWRRLARIYPVHVFALLALIGMVGLRGLLDTNFWVVADLPRHLLLLHAWTDDLTWNLPAWSISAEWAAYTAYPLFALLLLKPEHPLLPLLLAAGFFAMLFFGVIETTGQARAWLGWPALFRVLGEFGLGVFAFRLSAGLRGGLVWDGVALVGVVLLFASLDDLLSIVGAVIFIPAVALSAGPVRRIFASRIMVYLGLVSYSVYMIHFPVIRVMQNVNARIGSDAFPAYGNILLTCAWAVVITAMAALVYHLVEQPARQFLCALPRRRARAGGTAD